jgi:soluble lytic murein transglycosylase
MRRVLLALIVIALGCGPSSREVSEGALERPAAGDSVLIDAGHAFQSGQPWRASQILAPALRDSTQRTPERVLLAARAAAAWGGWSQVERLLAGEPWLDSKFDGLGRELLARASLAQREDSAALHHARLAIEATKSGHQQAVRRVLIARALDRMDSLDRAAASYVEAASMLPDIADWLRLRAAGVTDDSVSRAVHYAILQSPAAKSRVGWADARARERTRDFAGAAGAYSALGARVAALRLRLTAANDVGDTVARSAVRRELFDIVTQNRGSADARLAVEVIDSTLAPLTPAEELTVARSAAVSGPAARAIEGFARALSSDLGTPNDFYTYGSLLADAGRYREAVRELAKVSASSPLRARAEYERARALLRVGDVTRARSDLAAVAARHHADTTAASSALYVLGDLAVDEGRDDEARAFYRRVSTQYPTSALAPSARFRAALLAFVSGSFQAAALEFDTLALNRPRSSETLAGLYWSGRAWERAGDTAMSRARWEEILTKDPASYYAMLAARRLERASWMPGNATDSIRSDSTIVAALRRAELLRNLGMDTEADVEYDRIAENAAGSAETLLTAAQAFRQHGLTARAIRLAKRALANGAPRDRRLYRVLYPLAYEGLLTREAESHQLDRALVAALILQESNFNPEATSRAGARGLMQIMPAVGRQLASARRYHLWDASLLYQPEVSLELGTTHLAGLLSDYQHVSHALAAYNAGSSRARRWLERGGADDPEIFIERIPFRETRDYVRIVLRNRELYRNLYGG